MTWKKMLKLSIVYFTVDIVSSKTLNLNNVDRGKQVILLLIEENIEDIARVAPILEMLLDFEGKFSHLVEVLM